VVEDHTAVAEECWVSWNEGEVLVGVVCAEARESWNGSVFAAQVTDLAGRRVVFVAWRILATTVWIKMGGGRGTISGRWHRLVVDVVDWRHV
jgi:hypothetical protein